MYYGHNLRSNLQEWKSRLYKSNFTNIDDNYKFFFNKLNQNPVIVSILQNTIDNYPISKEDFEIYYKGLAKYVSGEQKEFVFTNEEHATALLYKVHIESLENGSTATGLCQNFCFGHDFNEEKNSFFENFIEPICNYIHDQLEESNSTLFLLEKYKKRVEWFFKKYLLNKYVNAENNYEQIFEDDLRLYLFDQGIDYPFSTPKSSSGRADVIGLIDTKNPLVLEIKIYDSNKSYRKNRVIEGFAQVVKYSNDYNKNIGYLVIFNIDNIEIEIDSEDADKNFPNRISFNNKIFYIIVINLYNKLSASKAGSIKTEKITKEELISLV